MINQDYQDLNNLPLRITQIIHVIDIFESDAIIILSTAIPSISNTLKKNYLSRTILGEFTSTYYNDKNDSFEKNQQYTSSYVNNIYHPSIIEEWRANMD